MKRTFNVYSDNYFEFPDMIFVYTSITLKSRYIRFNGVAIDMLNDSKFVAYKNSTVKLNPYLIDAHSDGTFNFGNSNIKFSRVGLLLNLNNAIPNKIKSK